MYMTDINECEGNHPCSQSCINTDGSYYCNCLTGFSLDQDTISCIGILYLFILLSTELICDVGCVVVYMLTNCGAS